MTKREALRKCRDMWQWLADNPTKDKYDYIFTGEEDPENQCYACQYTVDRVGLSVDGIVTIINCKICPLLKLWTDKKVVRVAPCERRHSPYAKWQTALCNNSDNRNSKYAQQIADFCRNELRRK